VWTPVQINKFACFSLIMGSGAMDLQHLHKLQYLKYAGSKAFAVL
jgi:hypothetical protein